MAVVYCLWNVYWLSQWRLPPSLFQSTTGLPCPTTGCTRGLQCLLHGDWEGSLHWNAMTVPIVVLFAATIGCVVHRLIVRQRVQISRHFLYAWGAILAAAWVGKLMGSPSYW